MDKKELLGKRIKELRKKHGLTQDALAEKLKIEPRQLSKLETGKHYPSFETVLAILETFDIKFEELMAFEHLQSSQEIKQVLLENIMNTDGIKLREIYKLVRYVIN